MNETFFVLFHNEKREIISVCVLANFPNNFIQYLGQDSDQNVYGIDGVLRFVSHVLRRKMEETNIPNKTLLNGYIVNKGVIYLIHAISSSALYLVSHLTIDQEAFDFSGFTHDKINI